MEWWRVGEASPMEAERAEGTMVDVVSDNRETIMIVKTWRTSVFPNAVSHNITSQMMRFPKQANRYAQLHSSKDSD
jgi:hypothetical protein